MDEDISNYDELDNDDIIDDDAVALDDDNTNPEEEDANDEEEEEEEVSILHKIKEAKYDIIPFSKTYQEYYVNKKVCKPFITKFEKAKVIGVRAEMIASGSPAMINVPKGVTSAYDISMLEFKAKKIPLMIRRFLPNGQFEDWRLEDLVIS